MTSSFDSQVEKSATGATGEESHTHFKNLSTSLWSSFCVSEMVETSEACRMWDKYVYWTEFEANRHQFFKVMIGDFRLRLRIPRKFVKNFKKKLADTILLKGPSGNMWAVELTRTNDDVFFENGWEKFVQDHSLEDTNFLVFHYDGNSSFEVQIFDATGCEREGSYFVKKHSSCSNNRCAIQEKEKEDNVQFIDLNEAEEDHLKVVKLKKGKGTQSSKLLGTNFEKKQNTSRVKLLDPEEDHEHTLQKGKLKTVDKDTPKHEKLKGMKGKGFQSTKPTGGRQNFRLEREEETESNFRLEREEETEEDSMHVVDGSATWENAEGKKLGWENKDDSETPEEEVDIHSFKHKEKKKNRIQSDVLEKFNSTEEEACDEFISAHKQRKCNHRKEKHGKDEDEVAITEKPYRCHPFISSSERRQEAQRISAIHLLHKFKKEEEFSSTWEEPKLKSDTTKKQKDQKQTFLLYFNSNRREVTEEEKQRAYELATRYSSAEPSFLLTMKPTNVYKSFRLTIPREWAAKHMPCECEEIQLRVPPSGRKWAAQLKPRPQGCVINRGWANFVLDNNLEEYDACIFKLAQGGHDKKMPIILDVIIFRVVKELIPLTRFSNPF